VIDTDIHHEINQQVVYYGNNEKVTIDRGTPLAMYIPFKREKHKYKISSATDKDMKYFSRKSLEILTKRTGSGAYRLLQRERDKKK
jgi:hypothetical protein